jgi:exodeoxyribonuclease-5
MTIEQADLTPSQIRYQRRVARREREDRRKAKFDIKTSPVASAVASVMKTKITFEDLDEYQLHAYRGIHDWWDTGARKPLILGGYSGCGKTSLLSVVFPALRNADGSEVGIVYCAYTGKATNVLRTKGLEAQTIHSLIYDAVPSETDPSEIVFILKNPEDIPYELIVVDEASMVHDSMREDLESLGLPVLYTGDHGQLPPVSGDGNVMEVPDYKLEEVHRQALDSGVIKIATDVRKGITVAKGTYGVKGDATKLGKDWANNLEFIAGHDMVVCYTNATRHSFNEALREYKGFSGRYPKVGESLICKRNNKITGMTNGLILEVTAIREEESCLIMDGKDEAGNQYYGLKVYTNYFDGYEHPKIFGRTTLDIFEFGYCLTGHAVQGSQWDSVCVIEEVMRGQSTDMKRRWLYTVLTRAIKRLTWISRHG